MKIWITKYALTKGIMEKDFDGPVSDNPSMAQVKLETCKAYFFKPDWHTTENAALERAIQMRDEAVISLEKRVKKLKAKVF